MARSLEKEEYFLEHNPDELQRLREQHKLIKDSMGGLILAPIDFSKPGLRILDSATADGVYCARAYLTSSVTQRLNPTYRMLDPRLRILA
jgi:hypothetical protein